MRYSFTFLLFFLYVSVLYAQPSPFGTDVHAVFKDEKGNIIRRDNKSYDIKWITVSDTLSYRIDLSEKDEWHNYSNNEDFYVSDSLYIVDVVKTPIGGGIKQGSHFLIIKNNVDTMRLYPPLGHFDRKVFLDDIYFRAGNYKIPELVYMFHYALKTEMRRLFRPNLYDDWELFRMESEKPVFRIMYAECTELFTQQEKANSLLSFLRPFNYDNWFSKKYFKEDYQSLYLNRFMSGNSWYVKEEERTSDYHTYFGLFSSGVFIFQKEQEGIFEYGLVKAPVKISDTEEKDSNGKIRFVNLDDLISLDVTNMRGSNSNGYYDIIGYYHGIRQYFENRGYEKPMWGIFKLHINPLSTEEMNRIATKHAKDNGLCMDEYEARKLYDTR